MKFRSIQISVVLKTTISNYYRVKTIHKPVFLCQLPENSMFQHFKAIIIRECFTIIIQIQWLTWKKSKNYNDKEMDVLKVKKEDKWSSK